MEIEVFPFIYWKGHLLLCILILDTEKIVVWDTTKQNSY